MQTRILTIEEIREVYEKYLYYDFPDDERKPLSRFASRAFCGVFPAVCNQFHSYSPPQLKIFWFDGIMRQGRMP